MKEGILKTIYVQAYPIYQVYFKPYHDSNSNSIEINRWTKKIYENITMNDWMTENDWLNEWMHISKNGCKMQGTSSVEGTYQQILVITITE